MYSRKVLDSNNLSSLFSKADKTNRKIDYYLKHDKEREAIRLAGFKRTKKDHTYTKRWADIIKILENTK